MPSLGLTVACASPAKNHSGTISRLNLLRTTISFFLHRTLSIVWDLKRFEIEPARIASVVSVDHLIARLELLKISFAVLILFLAGPALSQTYQVGPEPPRKPGTKIDPNQSAGKQLGWGSNIQNARLARAAQLALDRGDHALALDYAERAARSAPNDAEIQFLLGYAARLGGRYGQSADAYQRGLQLNSSSLNGMSGLAQTYSLMGRTDEAERLLKHVVTSDPRRRNDLSVLGDLYMRAGDYPSAIEWLGRAERIEPAAQSELLMAVAYEHLNQLSLASHYLEMAKNRAPNNPDVERSLAQFYRQSGDYGKAVEALRAIHNPAPDVVAELAFTYGLDGKLEDSGRLYMQAANSLPRNLGLQLSAAQGQVTLGSIDSAEQFLLRAAQLDPDYYRLHAIRGDIAQRQDRPTDAITEFGAAVAHLPGAPAEGPLYGIQLHMGLQTLYLSQDETDLAHRQLQIAQTQIGALGDQGGNQPAFLRLRAQIKMNAGQLDSALTDMEASLKLTPRDPNSLQLDGDLLMKLGRTADAIEVYESVLTIDPRSRFALTSLGYASRAAGNDGEAERYFNLLARDYPASYVPFLALGDLYTARRDFPKAQAAYSRGYALAPQNALIVSGGMDASIESHDLPLAGNWLKKVTAKMENVPRVLREKERYFSFMGDFQQSAELGRKALAVLPRDRDVVVYLAYDLLHLEQYAELQDLTAKYTNTFPKDPDVPLLAGYVSKHDGRLESAIAQFTEALNRDPNVVTAYTSRGFVFNDLLQPARAAADFEESIKREPRNGEAHMGLAFAELNLGHYPASIRQTELAEEILGDSEPIHLVRATAYGRQGLLSKSASEYLAALKFDPKNGSLYLAVGNIFFAEYRYREAVTELETAQNYLPENASIYALMARANANLQEREKAMHDIELAEKYAGQSPGLNGIKASADNTLSDIYMSTGEALATLGDPTAAMQRFNKALVAPNGNRVGVRLAIARLMVRQDRTEDVERQLALAQMEADAGDTPQPSGEQYLESAGLLQQLHEYVLSQSYIQRARAAGAADANVRIALANSYVALGETRRAAAELAAVKHTGDSELEYQYLLAEASVYQQEHRGEQALSAFAQAASAAGENQTVQENLLQAGANEGYRINSKFSILSNLTVQPIFEDSTVYVLDSKLNSPAGPVPVTNLAQLPPPRSSIETNWINAFHLHLGKLPNSGGYFQIQNIRGNISVPATSSIVHRNTNDYTMNFAVNPTFHIGNNVVSLNSGIQGTLRRDSLSPVEVNQNLFRIFTFFTTSSFFNAISADGFVTREVGPFTQTPIYEHGLTASINFRVGSPWGKTALVTGWGLNDQSFTSLQRGNSENHNTSSYIGLSHRFSKSLAAEAIVEDIRSWRAVPFSPIRSAISQALRPAAKIDYSPSPHLDIQASSSYESTRGFHVYDVTQNAVSVAYTRPLGRTFNDETGDLHVKYPIRFSGGIQQETFLNFSHGSNQQFRPYFSITIF